MCHSIAITKLILWNDAKPNVKYTIVADVCNIYMSSSLGQYLETSLTSLLCSCVIFKCYFLAFNKECINTATLSYLFANLEVY